MLKNKIVHKLTFYLVSVGTAIIFLTTLFQWYLSDTNLGIILITNAISTLLFAFSIVWFLHVQILRHYQKITNYLATLLETDNQTTALNLDRPPHNDELEQLVNSINDIRLFYQNIYTDELNAQNLLNSSLIGLSLWHFNGQLVKINPAFAKIIGYSVPETLKMNYWDDIVVEDDAVTQQKQLEALPVGTSYGPYEREYRHKDGYLVLVKTAATSVVEEGKHYVWSYAENISGQKWVTMELQKAKEKAEEANLIKTKFLANMSHELRTPMNTIVGYTEILEEEIKECDKVPHLLQDVKNVHIAAKHLLGTIDDILDVSKIEAGKMQVYVESFDLKILIQNTISTIQPLIVNKANALHFLCDKDIGKVHTDKTKIRQILFNLLSNASKFTDQGIITLEVEQDGDWVNIRISDEGIGMTKEQQANLFQPFAKIEALNTRKDGGTSLGLAISKHFVEMLSGTISVTSEFGRGSCFTVRLPSNLTVEKPSQASDNDPPQIRMPEIQPEGGVLLVVDDDKNVRDLLDAYLSKVGYQVVAANDGIEGLKLAKKIRPDAITLDVMMPGMDGWEVLSKLKADPELAHIPVIMLTIMEDQEIGYSLGASEYLTKPVTRTQLINVLRKYRSEQAPCTVMVIEDDPSTREILVRMLNMVGWQIIEAENGKTALQHLNTYKPDLILLDLMMPEMDGFEFIVQLRQHNTCASVPIVVLSAKDLTIEDRLWLNNRVQTVFQKGAYSRKELLAELRRLLVCAVSKSQINTEQCK